MNQPILSCRSPDQAATTLAPNLYLPGVEYEDVDNLPPKEVIDKWCIEMVRLADDLIKSSIILPRGHEWSFPGNRFIFGESPADAVENGASIFLGKPVPEPCVNSDHISDPDQISLEIRIQLPTRQYRTKKGSVGRFRKAGETGYRMFLWIKSGSKFAGQGTYHVQDTFPDGPATATLEEAVSEVARVANAIFYDAIPSRMPQRMTEAQYEVKVGQLAAEIKRHEAGKKNPSLPLAAKIKHNRARNTAQEKLRELRLNRFALTRD